MINFNEGLELPNRFSGSEKKKTIIFQNRRYLVKFPDPAREKKLETSYINNVYSEYIGSLIFKSAGMPTQTTVLGTYRLLITLRSVILMLKIRIPQTLTLLNVISELTILSMIPTKQLNDFGICLL